MRPLLALLVGLAAAAPVPKAVKKKDVAAQLVGRWKPNGKGTCWFEFRDDGTLKTWHTHNGNTDSALDWTWAIDPDESTPRRIRLKEDHGRRERYDCAFELDGDALKFAFLHRVKEMPEKLDASVAGLELYDLTRDTPAK